MKIRLIQSEWSAIECDALLLPVFEDDNLDEGVPGEVNRLLNGLLSELRDNGEWQGRVGDLTVIYRPSGLAVGRLILLGSGPRAKYDTATIRTVIMNAVYKVKAYSLKRVVVYRRSDVDPDHAAQAAVEGVVLGTYDTDGYKTIDRSKTRIEEILFATGAPLPVDKVEAAMKRGEVLAQASNLARTLVNEPGNRLGPPQLAEKAKEVAERVGLEIEILGEPEIEELGMLSIMAVARGSDEPARFIILKHFGGSPPDAPPIVLVGKGVTFDSGGLSLKPPASMVDMKTDKAGGCAVLAAMQAIAQLQIPSNVVGLIPAAENLPSARAQRPGDVIRSMSGKTIEVVNTDAEGRLLLADAMHYAQRFKPRFMVDLATLTGACVIALGKQRAGLFGNSERLRDWILEASAIAGEPVWPLPVDPDHLRELKSEIADLKNMGDRWGGASIAAAFLQEFVGGVEWAHLDIAGVDLFKECGPIKGPTGFGVRTLVELVSLLPQN